MDGAGLVRRPTQAYAGWTRGEMEGSFFRPLPGEAKLRWTQIRGSRSHLTGPRPERISAGGKRRTRAAAPVMRTPQSPSRDPPPAASSSEVENRQDRSTIAPPGQRHSTDDPPARLDAKSRNNVPPAHQTGFMITPSEPGPYGQSSPASPGRLHLRSGARAWPIQGSAPRLHNQSLR